MATDNIIGPMRFSPGTGPCGFVQGSPPSELCRGTELLETQFLHILSDSLAVMETGVTIRMWEDLRAAQPSLPFNPTDDYDVIPEDRPLQQVTWYATVLFANLLSIENGLTPCYYTDATRAVVIDDTNYTDNNFIYCDFSSEGYRLPTEGERERLARAETTTIFPVTEPNYNAVSCSSCSPFPALTTLNQFAVTCGNAPSNHAEVVATKNPNPWNLYDTHGNLLEWCWDRAGSYPAISATDWRGPTTGPNRILRGGSWYTPAEQSRSAKRRFAGPTLRSTRVGFRLVRVLNP